MASTPAPPRRGAQPGNLNAFKHGFYSRRLSRRDLKDLESAEFKGLAEEIAVMRIFMRRILERYDTAADLFETLLVVRTLSFAFTCLDRMLKTHHFLLSQGAPIQEALEQAINQVFDEWEKEDAAKASFVPFEPSGGT